MSLEEAQTLVMNARVQLGWVDPADLRARRRRERKRREGPGLRPSDARGADEGAGRAGAALHRHPRRRGPKAGLIRFVAGPDDEVVPDLAERLPGRGMWVSADAAALRQAAAKGHFARAAKRQVKAPADLAARVEALLAARLVDLVALARKAGQAVAGLEKTKAALVSGEAVLLLQAADGSSRERAQLRPPEGENSLVSCLFAHELGVAFARDRVIHAAVLAGGLSDRIRDEALRLSGIRDVTWEPRRRRPGRTDWRGKAPAGKARDGMMDNKDGTGKGKTLGLRGGGTETSHVRQSFSHGRTKSVTVEHKRKRILVPKPGAPANGQGPARVGTTPEPLGRRVRAAAEGRRGRQGAGIGPPAARARGRRGPRGRARAPARREGGRRARREGARDPGAARRRRRRRGCRGRGPRRPARQARRAAPRRPAGGHRPRRRPGPGRARRGRPPDRAEEGGDDREGPGRRREARPRQGRGRPPPLGQAHHRQRHRRGGPPALHGGDEAPPGAREAPRAEPFRRAREGGARGQRARRHHRAGARQPHGRARRRGGEGADAERRHGHPEPDHRPGDRDAHRRGVRPQGGARLGVRTWRT